MARPAEPPPQDLCVIPARGGSKRIPRKNVRPFGGRPMIAWSIDAARRSGCFARIVVSTDDEEIAAVARAHGAETPFMRPAALADDHAGTMAVMAHAVAALEAEGERPGRVCCLYATAPLVRPGDLARGRDAMAGDIDYALAVAAFPSPIERALRVSPEGRATMIDPARYATRSQDLEPAYHDAGQFYWGRAAAWREGRPFYGRAPAAIVLPAERVQDIDTPEDWRRAEALVRLLDGER